MDITEFRGEDRFLSNFFPCPLRLGGRLYPTAEHAFQAAKTLIPEERERVAACRTPGDAKRLGRRLTLRPGWDALRFEVMEALLRQKFRPGSALARRLLATGEAELVEGNSWGDRLWGVCGGVGENRLGRLLMQIRAELRG